MHDNLLSYLKEQSTDGLLPWTAQDSAAVRFGLSHGAVEETALKNGILPARYQRNRKMLDLADQVRLFGSRVAVIGCGGLGGFVIEELARLGVGQLVAVDPDIFEEHNLNRQLLSSPKALGKPKVEMAYRRVAEINPAVTVTAHYKAYVPSNAREILRGVDVAVDALDSIAVRLELAQSCAELGIPMVYGAIGGWYGQVATQLPGDRTVQHIYRNWTEGKGIEAHLGNPSFTPAVVASLEVAEVCKLLLGKGEVLRKRKLSIDLLEMEVHEISYEDVPEDVASPAAAPGRAAG